MNDLAAAKSNSQSTLRRDFLASIVVFLVALPLCMGIAIASGAPPAAGLITGIVGGLLVGMIAGSPLQVSGPAAGLSVIVYDLVQKHGFETLGVVVLIAGVCQMLAGALRLGQWFRAVSPAVIQGMLAGIGVLIFASQFHVMVDDKPYSSGIENLFSIPMAIWKGFLPLAGAGGNQHQQAAIIGLVTVLAIVGWKFLAPKKLQVIPAPLVAITLGTLFASVMQLGINRVDVPGNLLDAVTLPGWGAFSMFMQTELLLAGLAMALVASAETLLCATAVDAMHSGPRTKYDRELTSQGLGNAICGLLGALPMTGVIVRSSANVDAGARTRSSAVLHGVWLLIFVAALPFVLRQIPTSALAALLVYTGYKLVNPAAIRKIAEYGRGELAIYVATVVMIVATDLLTGVLVGVGLSILKLVYTFSHLVIDVESAGEDDRVVMDLVGAATIVRLPKLAAALETIPPNSELHVQFEHLDYIDHACLNLLMEWEKQHEATGGRLIIDWDTLTARFRNREERVKAIAQNTRNGAREFGQAKNEPELAVGV